MGERLALPPFSVSYSSFPALGRERTITGFLFLKIQNERRTRGSVKPRSVSKCHFDSLEVISLPAVFRALLLALRDAPEVGL